jgi:hypothetical protein
MFKLLAIKMTKTKLESKIREIISDSSDICSPDQIIIERGLLWKFNKNWVKFRTEDLLALFETELKERDKEIDHLRIQLAGCSVAALGGTGSDSVAKKGNYGWSASYQDVLDLRIKFNELKGEGK